MSHRAAANRSNALASTGPRTLEGKARSSQNAMRHGLRAGDAVVPKLESEDAWQEHVGAWYAALAPVGRLEAMLAERVAVVTWRLNRVVRLEVEEASAHNAFPELHGVSAMPGHSTEERVVRYEAHLERCFYRALHTLERLQTARAGGKVSAPMVINVGDMGSFGKNPE